MKSGSRMSSQEEQIQQRRANLEALTRLGVAPYPNKFARRHSVSLAGER